MYFFQTVLDKVLPNNYHQTKSWKRGKILRKKWLARKVFLLENPQKSYFYNWMYLFQHSLKSHMDCARASVLRFEVSLQMQFCCIIINLFSMKNHENVSFCKTNKSNKNAVLLLVFLSLNERFIDASTIMKVLSMLLPLLKYEASKMILLSHILILVRNVS